MVNTEQPTGNAKAYDPAMDQLLKRYAASAAAHASAVQDLSALSKTRHTRSAYMAALNAVTKTWQECEQDRLAFWEPLQTG